ncbi:MAG: hypothetical protein RL641_326 [Candidatus Parcubacteria bacterium]|jgi:hypothetical protein
MKTTKKYLLDLLNEKIEDGDTDSISQILRTLDRKLLKSEAVSLKAKGIELNLLRQNAKAMKIATYLNDFSWISDDVLKAWCKEHIIYSGLDESNLAIMNEHQKDIVFNESLVFPSFHNMQSIARWLKREIPPKFVKDRVNKLVRDKNLEKVKSELHDCWSFLGNKFPVRAHETLLANAKKQFDMLALNGYFSQTYLSKVLDAKWYEKYYHHLARKKEFRTLIDILIEKKAYAKKHLKFFLASAKHGYVSEIVLRLLDNPEVPKPFKELLAWGIYSSTKRPGFHPHRELLDRKGIRELKCFSKIKKDVVKRKFTFGDIPAYKARGIDISQTDFEKGIMINRETLSFISSAKSEGYKVPPNLLAKVEKWTKKNKEQR